MKADGILEKAGCVPKDVPKQQLLPYDNILAKILRPHPTALQPMNPMGVAHHPGAVHFCGACNAQSPPQVAALRKRLTRMESLRKIMYS
jgi:hypothetical protein